MVNQHVMEHPEEITARVYTQRQRLLYRAGADVRGWTESCLPINLKQAGCFGQGMISQGQDREAQLEAGTHSVLCWLPEMHSPFQFLTLSKLDKEILLGTRAT